ncbi:hypothetical protein CEXT_63911 [Caerostris extrusa]|uniref:Uncharacterized protein n=1 Tax=Caerostris extrusa TaxID=172846 RepID=A0AAV4VI51_CAEEX|nr:hypothetical protein CEXT_63911 [Caerostris extrusa]
MTRNRGGSARERGRRRNQSVSPAGTGAAHHFTSLHSSLRRLFIFASPPPPPPRVTPSHRCIQFCARNCFLRPVYLLLNPIFFRQ